MSRSCWCPPRPIRRPFTSRSSRRGVVVADRRRVLESIQPSMSNHSGLVSSAPDVRYWKISSMFRLFRTTPVDDVRDQRPRGSAVPIAERTRAEHLSVLVACGDLRFADLKPRGLCGTQGQETLLVERGPMQVVQHRCWCPGPPSCRPDGWRRSCTRAGGTMSVMQQFVHGLGMSCWSMLWNEVLPLNTMKSCDEAWSHPHAPHGCVPAVAALCPADPRTM